MRRMLIVSLPLLVLGFLVTTGSQQAAAQSKTVSILATWGGDEEAGFRAVLDAFARCRLQLRRQPRFDGRPEIARCGEQRPGYRVPPAAG